MTVKSKKSKKDIRRKNKKLRELLRKFKRFLFRKNYSARICLNYASVIGTLIRYTNASLRSFKTKEGIIKKFKQFVKIKHKGAINRNTKKFYLKAIRNFIQFLRHIRFLSQEEYKNLKTLNGNEIKVKLKKSKKK
ncbi:MAG: hypothetical protein ABIL49_04845 [candidate division WOR-3 bacterium]|jgi:site-specific recombinase XerC